MSKFNSGIFLNIRDPREVKQLEERGFNYVGTAGVALTVYQFERTEDLLAAYNEIRK